MEIRIFVSLSGCPCCSDGNEEAIRCSAFVEKASQKYGESTQIRVFSAASEEFLKLRSTRSGGKLTAPVVIVDGKIVSAGKYPHNV
jgi:hypothetical protein